MRALTLNNHELRLEDRETPSPGPFDVLVEVKSAGVNAADLLQRSGHYPVPPDAPQDIPGMELAGVVVAVGDRVVEPLLGRRVAALVGGGAQATHCVVASEHLIFLPDHVTWNEAGGFAEAFATAHDALATQGRLAAGERALISGAAGGVGVAGIQIARALGATVVAATRTPQYHRELAALGANETVTTEEVSGIEPVDVVMELVGAAHLARAQKRLRPFARVVVIGVSSGGSRVDLELLTLMSTRASITGSTLRSRSRAEKAEVIRRVNDVIVPRWNAGEVRVPVDRTFDLEEAEAAYRHFAEAGKLGKVVLRVSE